MRYAVWVPKVLHALAEVTASSRSTGLNEVGAALNIGDLTWDDFVKQVDPGRALVTAMRDLEQLGLVEFENVSHGNSLTAAGREVSEHGFDQVVEVAFGMLLSDAERTFLARLYERSRIDSADWADLIFVDVDEIYAEAGLAGDDYADVVRRLTFLGDLVTKGLIRAESSVIGNSAYRPTFPAAAFLSEDDPRSRGRRAGLIDWSVPTPGFGAIEDRLADLKVALAAAVTDDDLSDVGRRCREIPADAIDVVFRAEMVPAGEAAPSRQDAEERLRLYLAVRAQGEALKEYRKFLRASLELANARTHSARSGRVAAVAAAQGLLSFVRALQAIERSAKVTDTAGPRPAAEA